MRPLDLRAPHLRVAQLQAEGVQHSVGGGASGHGSGRRLMMVHRLVRHAVAAPRTTAMEAIIAHQNGASKSAASRMVELPLGQDYTWLL